MTMPSIEERMEMLLKNVAAYQRQCRACGETLFFVPHWKSGKYTPYTKDGLNHFVNCPHAKEFRRTDAANANP
jgi:hypothetical protein